MLDVIKGFTEQVTEYSTILGQIWYLCVFLFRGMVVVTIGGEVYSDEQSEFQCSTQEIGCGNVCFAKFSKISHIRFWAFQLLAVSTPTILFHFFVIGVRARIEKGRAYAPEVDGNVEDWAAQENSLKNTPGNQGQYVLAIYGVVLIAFFSHDQKFMKRRAKKKNTRVRFKSVYDATSNNLKDVAVTDSIYGAYYVNVICRGVIEGVFIYLSYGLFKFMNHTDEIQQYGVFDFVWFSVPMLFKCEGDDVSAACHQHTSFGPGGYVPCWVSRPWEKTIFLRYMNILSCLCFLLSIFEFVYLSLRGTRTAKRRREKRRNRNIDAPYPTNEMSNLAIPIRMTSLRRYEDSKDTFVDMEEDEDYEEREKKFDV